MAEHHGIDGLSADLGVAEAARLALAVRLHAVRDQLQSTDCSPEALHDLRVASRRAAAAVDVFRICIRRKAANAAKEMLRSLRRAAGLVRDWDVLIALLRNDDAPRNESLKGYCLGRRDAAVAEFVKTVDDSRSGVLKMCDRLPRRVRGPKAEAIRRFRDLAPSFEALLHDFTKDLKKHPVKAAEFHLLRVDAKKLRYAMELFAPCFEPRTMAETYPQVEAMQTHLGDIQDANAAVDTLESIQKTIFTADVVAYLQAKREEAEIRFEACRKDWTP